MSLRIRTGALWLPTLMLVGNHSDGLISVKSSAIVGGQAWEDVRPQLA